MKPPSYTLKWPSLNKEATVGNAELGDFYYESYNKITLFQNFFLFLPKFSVSHTGNRMTVVQAYLCNHHYKGGRHDLPKIRDIPNHIGTLVTQGISVNSSYSSDVKVGSYHVSNFILVVKQYHSQERDNFFYTWTSVNY